MERVDDATKGIFRTCTFDSQSGLNFNRFLIDDEHPALIHTGTYPMYEE